MNKTIKRIIAREGLILAVIILFSAPTIIICDNTQDEYWDKISYICETHSVDKDDIYSLGPLIEWVPELEAYKDSYKKELREAASYIRSMQLAKKIKSINIIVLFFGYPLYLLIRFIIWAIKALKEK